MPALVGWSVAGGIAGLFLLERIPMVRSELSKVPFLKEKYKEYANLDD
jgi:hypothetical protein